MSEQSTSEIPRNSESNSAGWRYQKLSQGDDRFCCARPLHPQNLRFRGYSPYLETDTEGAVKNPRSDSLLTETAQDGGSS